MFYWHEIPTTYNPDVAAAPPGNILLPDIPTIVFPSISFLLGQPARFIVISAGIFVQRGKMRGCNCRAAGEYPGTRSCCHADLWWSRLWFW